jgi:PTS system nitrogen regulatory IIA component
MSLVSDLPIQFSAQAILLKAPIESKKRALEQAAELASQLYNLDADSVYEHLLTRERMGATALGEGLAIPHCRLERLQTPAMLFFTLAEGIDYNAQDGGLVDMIWTLLVPEKAQDAHLKVLAAIAQFLRDLNLTKQLREATSPETVFALIKENLCLPPT